jgi:hypothetical protein
MVRWAGMSRSDPSSGDVALLAGLSAAVTVMIGFGVLMYWLMQPTVLPNVPFDLAGQEKPAPIILRAASPAPSPDVEQSAIAMAARENDIQGLRPIAVARAEPVAAPAPAPAAAATTTSKTAKPRRAVAKAPRRDSGTTYASNWWGGGGHSHGFGGFGGWYR